MGYPGARVANRLPSMLTLKARAELALGRAAVALRTSESAVEIAAAMSLEPQCSASVGAALMALAETQRALGDSANAAAAARRAAASAYATALGPGSLGDSGRTAVSLICRFSGAARGAPKEPVTAGAITLATFTLRFRLQG